MYIYIKIGVFSDCRLWKHNKDLLLLLSEFIFKTTNVWGVFAAGEPYIEGSMQSVWDVELIL